MKKKYYFPIMRTGYFNSKNILIICSTFFKTLNLNTFTVSRRVNIDVSICEGELILSIRPYLDVSPLI
jgi:hypothetical protein